MAYTLFRSILSSLYKSAIKLRHALYDKGIFKTTHFDIPIICVGNITVGGTGKTPMTELVLSHFLKSHKVAVLSRGYKRKTKGYLEVKTTSHYRQVGDEPLQIKKKFPEAIVVVCEKRVKGINKIQENYPDVNLIIMDDGFQHRSVEAKINIITVDASRPINCDEMLPAGTLRDVPESLDRAHYFVVTKCPDTMTPIDKRLMRSTLIRYAYQKLFFCRYNNLAPQPLFPEDNSEALVAGSDVIAISGVGNPQPFLDTIGSQFKLVDHVEYDDHHVYRLNNIEQMKRLLEEHPSAAIIVTEKDAVKLRVPSKIPLEVRKKIYYSPIRINFIDTPITNFLKQLEDDLREN